MTDYEVELQNFLNSLVQEVDTHYCGGCSSCNCGDTDD
jgi:hypothetical protein